MTSTFLASVVCLFLVSAQAILVSPPNIYEPLADSVKYVLGTIQLQCKANGNPKPTYKWLLDDKDIPENGPIYIQDKVTGNLTIKDVSIREEGVYKCLAMNTINGQVIKAISPYIKIVLTRLGAFEDSDTPSAPIYKNPGDYVALSCDNVPYCAPKGQFDWRLSDNTDIEKDDRKFVDEKGTFHFLYVKLEDDKGTVPYKCSVYNEQIRAIHLGSPKILHVNRPTSGIIPQSKPQIVYQTQRPLGEVGGSIELQCAFSGNPVPAGPSIEWKDNSMNIIPDAGTERFQWKKHSLKRILVITNIKESDEGTYSCTGKNIIGSASAHIFLNVTSKPIWMRAMVSKTGREGQNVEFPCVTRPAQGEEELPTPKWYKNGNHLTIQNTEKFEFSDRNRVLTVKNVNKITDIMCLQCEVSNEFGRTFGEGCLNVVLPITVSERPPEKQEITKGDIVLLTVKASTEEGVDLKYKWFFQDKTYDINPPDHVTYDPDTLEAYINTSMLTDEEYRTINGTYIREVFYDYDRINVTTVVILKEHPVVGPVVIGSAVVGPVVAAQVDLWWIALIVALIILIVVIIIICVICHRKKQEGVYPLDKKERAADLDPEKDLADSGFHDLSRADPDDDYPSKPKINPDSLDDDQFSDNEDDASLMEYGGDIDPGKFNEDGSFIGQYAQRKPPPPVSYQPNEVGTNIGQSEV